MMVALSVRELTLRYGRRLVLANVSFDLGAGHSNVLGSVAPLVVADVMVRPIVATAAPRTITAVIRSAAGVVAPRAAASGATALPRVATATAVPPASRAAARAVLGEGDATKNDLARRVKRG